jgi:hypothetical protein
MRNADANGAPLRWFKYSHTRRRVVKMSFICSILDLEQLMSIVLRTGN